MEKDLETEKRLAAKEAVKLIGSDRIVSYKEQNKQLTEIKEIRTELRAVNSQVLQDALRRLDKLFKAFVTASKTSHSSTWRHPNRKRRSVQMKNSCAL